MDGFPTFLLWMVSALPLALAFGINLLIILENRRLNVYAQPDKRRHHIGTTPLLGGAGIIIAIVVSVGLLYTQKIDIFPGAKIGFLILSSMISTNCAHAGSF
jgi:UDP-N-acetylmuramyl pentapeptide phosphotransferase/UDP-N-acetylglucosamine-1-phosphate transferase